MSKKLLKIFMLVVFIASSVHVLHAESESKSLTVEGGTNNSGNQLKYTRFVNMYYMAANASTGWTIHSANIQPSNTWTLSTTLIRALGGGQADEGSSTAELFGAHIHGQISQDGGGDGTMPVFDVYGQHSGSLALEREKDKIIVGDSTTFALMENGTVVPDAYWKCYLQNTSAPAWTSGGGSISLPATGTTTPGNYIVEARSDSNNDKDKKTSILAYIKVNLTSTSTAICAKPNNTSISSALGLASSEFVKEIAVDTDPIGNEDKVVLGIKTLSPTQADKGSISKDSNTKWDYFALTESNSNLNPGGANRCWTITVEDDFSKETKLVFIKSVFSYLVTSSKTEKQDKALTYVIWKYLNLLQGKNIGIYDSGLSDYGYYSHVTGATRYGVPCFQPDAENILVSTILHEDVHANQSFALLSSASLGKLDYMATRLLGLVPEPPELPFIINPVWRPWADAESPAYRRESDSRNSSGIIHKSGYLENVVSWLTFFEWLRQ